MHGLYTYTTIFILKKITRRNFIAGRLSVNSFDSIYCDSAICNQIYQVGVIKN